MTSGAGASAPGHVRSPKTRASTACARSAAARRSERADVERAVGSQPLGHPQAGIRVAHAELEEADARKMAALAVVRRLQLADLPRLQQRRRQLRARLGGAEVVDVADQIERLRRVPARVREVARQPLAQPPGLADVEEPAVLAEQMIDAGRQRRVVEARARHVDDERPPVGGAALEVEQLVEPLDPPFARLLEEDAQDVRRDPCVGQRPMAVEAPETEHRPRPSRATGAGGRAAGGAPGGAYRARGSPPGDPGGPRARRSGARRRTRRCGPPAPRRPRSRGTPAALRRSAAPSSTIASVIPVSWTTNGEMRRPGLTSVLNVPVTRPPSRRTAPISVMPAPSGASPVVSRSKTTNAVSASGRRSVSWARSRQRASSDEYVKRGSSRSSVSTNRGPNSGSRPRAVKTRSISSSTVAPAGRCSRYWCSRCRTAGVRR